MATPLQKWEMNAGERALFFCCAVGAGHAPPATLRQGEPDGGKRTGRIYASPTNLPETPNHNEKRANKIAPPVGAAYMPPATKRKREPNG